MFQCNFKFHKYCVTHFLHTFGFNCVVMLTFSFFAQNNVFWHQNMFLTWKECIYQTQSHTRYSLP